MMTKNIASKNNLALIIFGITINGQSKQPSEMELQYSSKYSFFHIFLSSLIFFWYLGNLLISMYFIKIQALITFSIIINGQLKQPSKTKLHIWKWAMITAMSSGVKLHLNLGIIMYQVIFVYYFSKILILKNTGSISIEVRFWNKKYQYQYLEI